MSPSAPSDARLVLVVDDNARMRELARLFLEPHGFQCLEAASGDEALTLIADSCPDVIVLDHFMPERSGMDVLPDLRRACPGARIVMWASAPEIIYDARLLGADVYVDKADSLERLVAEVSAGF